MFILNQLLSFKINNTSPSDSQLNKRLHLCISFARRALDTTIAVAHITPTDGQGQEATQQDYARMKKRFARFQK